MIADVTFEKTIYQAPPLRFEAGTGNIADAVGLGAAIDYLDRIGMANIASYEHGLLDAAMQGLLDVPGRGARNIRPSRRVGGAIGNRSFRSSPFPSRCAESFTRRTPSRR